MRKTLTGGMAATARRCPLQKKRGKKGEKKGKRREKEGA
jgi:hypothetical protein